MSKSKRKSGTTPRKGRTQINAPELTTRASYRSAIGVDVHLQVLVCCYEAQIDDHRQIIERCEFYTDRNGLDQFVNWALQRQPEVLLMESTGVLWYSPYEALEDAGFTNKTLALVNARDVKAALGRKTDRKDAQRLTEYARSGNFKKSFVPPRGFRLQRLLARELIKNGNDFARTMNRYHKVLNRTGCRASTVFSDVNGKSASIILDAKISNDDRLEEIIRANCKRLKASPEEIIAALAFEIEPAIKDQLIALQKKLHMLARYQEQTFDRLRQLQEPYQADIELLMTIPGISETAARMIYAELSDDLKANFSSIEHFTSWLGICPGDNKSAGKQYSGKCPKGNKWLRRTLTESAQGVALSRKGAFYETFKALKLRRGTKRAIVATAHFLARVIYSVLVNHKAYVERVTTVLRDTIIERAKRAMRQLQHRLDVIIVDGHVVEKDTGAILGRVVAA